MKRKQTQSTLFECFRKPAPKATAASGDTSAAADDTIVTETMSTKNCMTNNCIKITVF